MNEFAALRNQPRYEEIRDERGILVSRRLIVGGVTSPICPRCGDRRTGQIVVDGRLVDVFPVCTTPV